MGQNIKYPLGQQSFVRIREDDNLYVDKTMFIERLLESGGKYFFLGRPRRFGKSLFLSTLECFFKGRRHLFRGLYIDTVDWDWAEYPVLYLDLNIGKFKEAKDFDILLENRILEWEKEYGVEQIAGNLPIRFNNIIQKAREKTGRQVVILVDEYDKPLVNNLHDPHNFARQRDKLAEIYSNFKTCAENIKMVFLTGVSRFAHLSVFSGLNNIRDISFDDEFCDICGITKAELRASFTHGVTALSEKLKKSPTEILVQIKSWYDGYRFSIHGKEIYNPYSLLYLMTRREFCNYWIQSGQATLLYEQLRRQDADIEDLANKECTTADLMGLDLDDMNIIALLYQTGYLTIKNYDADFDSVTVGFPNREVTSGFLSYLLPKYARMRDTSSSLIVRLAKELRDGKADEFMQELQSFFAGITYEMHMEREVNFQNAFFILMKLLGLYVEAERRTSAGRIDLFVATGRYYYIIELKMDGTARQALAQIEDRDYALPFATDGREIIKIGANFSSSTRTLHDWIVRR